ncbi:variant erythrocyte surface antigen-1 family protein [Babesia caballi]|uniref:Variant erythrocyte surface antigen-1 family protein n=1 Tax=Babesia caballi TaxID=5871 RepID=A0AAV4LMX6_BABCB|nr:variant erythrocyte surface antigen-1 family protein [Babesia caballi]
MIGNAIKGKDGVYFDDAIGKVIDISQGSSRHKISDILQALKNVHHLKEKSNLKDLAQGLKNYLEGLLDKVSQESNVRSASDQVSTLRTDIGKLLDGLETQDDIFTLINQVKKSSDALNATKPRTYPASFLVEGVTKGTENMLIPLKTGGYKSSYQPTQTWNGSANDGKIAQIFLGCLPLYYYWLTYLYWKCKQTRDQGGWEAQWFNGRGGGTDLKNFMVGHGYVADHLNGNKASEMIKTAFSGLTELTRATTTIQHSHTALLSALDNSLYSALPSSHSSTATLNGHSLSALFHLCRTYFTGKQIINPVTERRSPTSIREMLYWLCGLQFSPHYSDIEKQIEAFIPAQHGLPVADSGTSSPNNFITRDQMKGFLLSSCLSVPGVLGAIQGNTADTENEPWLYSLFVIP